MAEPAMRIDRFLWFARITRTRAAAQALAETRLVRIDGRRIERAHVSVRVGSVIAFPIAGRVRVLRVEALPVRRGPAVEAAACYAELSPGASESVDAGNPAA